MAKRSRKRLLRSPAVLFVAFVTILGLSGLVYALWITTLTIDGEVNTGNVAMVWEDAWSNDDGEVDDLVLDSGDIGDVNLIFDAHGPWSSDDPSEEGLNPLRYDKDVGKCLAYVVEGDQLNVDLDNVYPSYWCTVSATAQNEGSIPLRATAFDLAAWIVGVGEASVQPGTVEGAFALGRLDTNDAPIAEITGEIMAGIRCGTQVDPGQGYQLSGWLHVEEEATQGTTYTWTMDQEFVNWNEFSYFLCTEGAVAADADGNRIGIVDHDQQPLGVLLDS